MVLSRDASDSLALDALKKYGMDQTYRAKLLQISENITYLVENKTDHSVRGVLRISRPSCHTVPELRAELEWLQKIKKDSVLVVADPIPGLDGALVQLVISPLMPSIYTCVMFEFLTGSPPDITDEKSAVQHFKELGTIAAYLHGQVKGWAQAEHLKRFTWDSESMIGNHARWGSWKAAKELTPESEQELNLTCNIIKKRLGVYGKTKDNFGLIHANLRLSNLLLEGDQIKVINFDDSGFGWYMHDLAAGVSFIETKPITPTLVEAWIEGYRELRPLAKEDLAEVDTFIMQRRLQLLAWISSHYDSFPARNFSTGFLEGTMMLAEKYLSQYS